MTLDGSLILALAACFVVIAWQRREIGIYKKIARALESEAREWETLYHQDKKADDGEEWKKE